MALKRIKKILIICYLDGVANSIRPMMVKKFLERHGYEVCLLNNSDPKFFKIKERFKLISGKLANKRPSLEYYKKYPFIEDREACAETVLFYLKKYRYDAIICQSPASSYIFNKDIDCLKIYDCPSPIPFELHFGYEYAKKVGAPKSLRVRFYLQFTPECMREIRKKELEIYRNVDYLCFHWQGYAEYVKRHFYRGNNIFVLDWGCLAKRKRARWNDRASILFLGWLGDYWVNKELLSFLTKISPYPIHCYGKPRPEKYYKLNYRGHLANSNILNRYQFGLITITKDDLRRHGFSAKSLEYVSYGLPVLSPKWRVTGHEIDGFVYYDEANFVSQLEIYNDKKNWQKKSDEAYEYAQLHTWDKTLRPLLNILDKS